MVRYTFTRAGLLVGASALLSLWVAGAAVAAEPPSDESGPGIRFTPGMARGFAGVYVRHVIKDRYSLPADKVEEAQEKIARRLMQMAHKVDEPGADFMEHLLTEQFSRAAGGDAASSPWSILGKDFADRILPILPEVREMVRGVGQDIRPMLPMKQQLKMGADMMGFELALNGFEETMRKWVNGEITDYENPFSSQPPTKDENGETPTLKFAREAAEKKANASRAEDWAKYLQEFKELYELDAAQSATADSILREFTDREATLKSDQAWLDRMYRGRLWFRLSWGLPNAWMHPARVLVEENTNREKLRWDQLEEDFKVRLDTVLTLSQRRAADEKVATLLKKKGLCLEEVNP